MARRKRPRNLRSREKKPVAKTQSSTNGGGEVVLYEAPDGEVRLDVRLEQETVWLTQRQMATLFPNHSRKCLDAPEKRLWRGGVGGDGNY